MSSICVTFLRRENGQVLLQCVCGWLEYQLRPEVSQLVLAAAKLLVVCCVGLDVYKGLSLWPTTSCERSPLEDWRERVFQQQRRTRMLLWEATLLDFNTGLTSLSLSVYPPHLPSQFFQCFSIYFYLPTSATDRLMWSKAAWCSTRHKQHYW